MEFFSKIPDIYKGAILTFFTLVLIEFIRNMIDRKSLKKSFIIFVKLELSTILKSLERIKLKISEQNFFDFTYLIEIEKNLTELERARASAIYISESKQANYFDLVVEVRSFVNECRFVQNIYYDHKNLFEGRKDSRDINQIFATAQENQHFFDQKKVEKLVAISDLKNKLEKFIDEL